jgi:signal transduction histidine kinase
MQIQTRLFLGTAALVLALMAVQWWLHVRQLSAVERGLGTVAVTVGQRILGQDFQVFMHQLEPGWNSNHTVWIDEIDGQVDTSAPDFDTEIESPVLKTPIQEPRQVVRRVERNHRSGQSSPTDERQQPNGAVAVGVTAVCGSDGEAGPTAGGRVEPVTVGSGLESAELTVVATQNPNERLLVVRQEGGIERRIPIPVGAAVERVHGTGREGIVLSAGLLMAGLVASGVLARRLTRPLRRLADGAEALGRGDLGVEVPVTASGEIGDLQRAFNRMSRRLAELEAEREMWRRREQLAQLGDLSRGLAHTLRNPLNTLGLAVEELSIHDQEGRQLAETARAQIRRIDRWMRSFLALGAGDAAERVREDVCAIVTSVVLEALQEGTEVNLDVVARPLIVDMVPTAVRAALANLVSNAAESTDVGSPVAVTVRRDGDHAVIGVADRGGGLPEDVRRRLYAPHVTTKVGGSGMGLFLARQLVVEMHGGTLSVRDRDGGGTLAEMRLPICGEGDGPESVDS